MIRKLAIALAAILCLGNVPVWADEAALPVPEEMYGAPETVEDFVSEAAETVLPETGETAVPEAEQPVDNGPEAALPETAAEDGDMPLAVETLPADGPDAGSPSEEPAPEDGDMADDIGAVESGEMAVPGADESGEMAVPGADESGEISGSVTDEPAEMTEPCAGAALSEGYGRLAAGTVLYRDRALTNRAGRVAQSGLCAVKPAAEGVYCVLFETAEGDARELYVSAEKVSPAREEELGQGLTMLAGLYLPVLAFEENGTGAPENGAAPEVNEGVIGADENGAAGEEADEKTPDESGEADGDAPAAAAGEDAGAGENVTGPANETAPVESGETENAGTKGNGAPEDNGETIANASAGDDGEAAPEETIDIAAEPDENTGGDDENADGDEVPDGDDENADGDGLTGADDGDTDELTGSGAVKVSECRDVTDDTWKDAAFAREDGYTGPFADVKGRLTLDNVTLDGADAAQCDLQGLFTVWPGARIEVLSGGFRLSSAVRGLYAGKTCTLDASLDGKALSGSAVKWKSSNTAIVTVYNGKLTARAAGSCTITATYKDMRYTCAVYVFKAVSSLTLSADPAKLSAVGGQGVLRCTVKPAGAVYDGITYTSSAPDIVSVDGEGVYTAHRAGKATLKATAGGVSATVTVTAVRYAGSVSVTEAAQVPVGTVKQLQLTLEPLDTTEKTAKWTVSDKTIATVDASGRVRGVKPGTCTVTATLPGGASASCDVTVYRPVTGIRAAKTEYTLYVGKTCAPAFTLQPTNATYKQLTYALSDETVASVDENGVVTGIAPGKATLTAATHNGKKVSVKLNVMLACDELIPPEEYRVAVGATKKLSVGHLPENANALAFTYKSGNRSVATVDAQGNVRGVKNGTCTVTVTAPGGAACDVVVTVYTAATGIKAAKAEYTLYVGKTCAPSFTVMPANTTDKTLTYTISDETVASVDENGIVTGVGPGKATLTAATHNGKKVSVKLTVMLACDELIPPEEFRVAVGATKKLSVGYLPENANALTFTYKSGNRSVATVDAKGNVRGVKNGTCTVTVTAPGGAECDVTVTVYTAATGIKAAKAEYTLYVGKTCAPSFTVMPANTTDKTLTYTISDETVASVDENGVVTGVGPGKATLTATTHNGKKVSVKLTVMLACDELIPPEEFRVAVGTTKKLSVGYLPENANALAFTYKTDNRYIATVDAKGNVRGVKNGTCTVTVTAPGGAACDAVVTVYTAATGIKAAKTEYTLYVGKTVTPSFTVMPANTTDKTLTYTISDETAASVDENGVVTGIGPGKATLTAITHNGKKVSVKLTVLLACEELILPEETEVEKGATKKLSVGYLPENANALGFTYKSSDRTVATVDAKGNVKGLKTGTCTVTVTAPGGAEGTAVIRVIQGVTAVKLNKTTLTVAMNGTGSLTCTVTPSNAEHKEVTWSSSDESIVTVDENGTLTGLREGTATIKVKSGNGKTATCRVTVKEVRPTGITFDPYFVTLHPGETCESPYVMTPASVSDPAVRFSVSDPGVASIDANGHVTALGTGRAIVTVRSAANTKLFDTYTLCVIEEGEGRLSGVVIGLNPGHQAKQINTLYPVSPGSGTLKVGCKVGAAGKYTRIPEYQTNLEISMLLRDILVAEGATVVMTRTTNDAYLTNIQRADILNDAGVDIALQVHCNSSTGTTAEGISVYYRPGGDWIRESSTAAQDVIRGMLDSTGAKNAGVHTYQLYMSLNYTTTPSVLLEMGYLSNRKEDTLLNSAEYQQKMAEGIVNGLHEYFGR